MYACNTHILRRQLWHELASLQQSNVGPWCFLDDFNSVLGAHEMFGGSSPLRIACDEFQTWSDSCKLTHLSTKGAEFTWSNGRRSRAYIAPGLNRAICNDSWIQYWNQISCSTLTRSKSYNHPILLSISKEVSSHPSSFKFFKMWIDHPDCRRVASEKCSQIVESAMAAVDRIQNQIRGSVLDDDLFNMERKAQEDLQKALHFEEQFWKDRSRVKWHAEGDRNTSFFMVTKIRNASKQMKMLRKWDIILDN